MSDSDESPQLPAQIAEAVLSIPKGLVPASVKALDRLVGAAVDVPVAWLAQQKARIDAQTRAYEIVESAIANAAASEAGADSETVSKAVNVLVRKEYRKQVNREAVAAAMIEDLSSIKDPAAEGVEGGAEQLDDDWLNVFERYAEDASTDRMQKLWGRVLAGEVRQPGRYSMRTLRFLSEFSQSDAMRFASFAASAFGDSAPKKLVRPKDSTDIRHLIDLEAAGLIQGATGLGLHRTFRLNSEGRAFSIEGNLAIMLQGEPGGSIKEEIIALTPLGQELLSLLPGRDPRTAARTVAEGMRTDKVASAHIMLIHPDGNAVALEEVWRSEPAADLPE